MKKLTVLLAISMIVLIGCSTTQHVERADAPQWVPKASERLVGNGVTVVLRTGRVCEGKLVSLDQDGIQVSNQALGTNVSFPMDSIMRINGDSNAEWVVLGTLGGVIAGAAIGTEAGKAAEPRGWIRILPGLKEGIIGGVVGGVLVGATVGAVTITHNYVIGRSGNLGNSPRQGDFFEK